MGARHEKGSARYAAVVAVCTLKRVRPAGVSPMLRRCSCTAFAVMLVGLPTAQAADETLMLACEGTKTETSRYGGDAERRKAISLSIIIDFAARTVTGFPDVEGLVRPVITDVSETTFRRLQRSDGHSLVQHEWDHQSRDRRCGGGFYELSEGRVWPDVDYKLRAEMQASATDVLREATE
jgi:hypothetical protein